MFLKRLDHVNILTPRFADTVQFYETVMGMKVARSPITDGAFLLDAEGHAGIHLAGISERNYKELLVTNFGHRSAEETDPNHWHSTLYGSGAIDHLAFDCVDLPATAEHFIKLNQAFRYFYVAPNNVHQLFVRDPNYITLELNFREDVPAAVIAPLPKLRLQTIPLGSA